MITQRDIERPDYPPPTQTFDLRNGPITDCAIHHTAGAVDETPLQIDAFERSRPEPERFIFIPYNFIVERNGTISAGRPLPVREGATYGRHDQAASIVLVGNYEKSDAGYNGPIPDAQWNSLVDIVVYLHQIFPSIEYTYGHGDVRILFGVDYSDLCPGSEVESRLDELRKLVHEKLGR